MSLNYPLNTIWYIEASDDHEGFEGSAVAIRLRKKGETSPAETYLLTCVHVIRGTSEDGTEGVGRVLSNIRAWRPGVGKLLEQSMTLEIARDIKDVSADEIPQDERSNAADDWVVLKICDPQAACAAQTVGRWADAVDGEYVHIHGYLGGAKSLDEGVVTPVPTPDTFPFRNESLGNLRFGGDGTRPGISGGGVFTEREHRFVGIHRARDKEVAKLHAVSASHILWAIEETKVYEVLSTPVVGFGTISQGDDALRQLDAIWSKIDDEVDWRDAFRLALPLSSVEPPLPDVEADEREWQSAIRQLAALGVDQHGVHPLFRFVYLFSQDSNVEGELQVALTEWLGLHCPPIQKHRLTETSAENEKKERNNEKKNGRRPRIVIQMQPIGQDAATSPHGQRTGVQLDRPSGEDADTDASGGQQFRYRIWFRDFPTMAPPRQEHIGSREEFKEILEMAWQEVPTGHDPRNVWVELFLPKQLLSWSVEREQVRMMTFPSPVLGAEHHFVLRVDRSNSIGRLKSRLDKAQSLATQCSQAICLDCGTPLSNVPLEVTDGQHFMVTLNGNPAADDLETMHFCLVQKTSVLGVVWRSPPEVSRNISQPDGWDAAIGSGVPLIMWLRESPPECTDNADLKDHFQEVEWDLLPDKVQALRLTAATQDKDSWHMGRHLAILLDDPKHPLPSLDRSARLRSPH